MKASRRESRIRSSELSKRRGSIPPTIVCPVTTRVKNESEVLRVHLKKGIAQLTRDCDIMIDQIMAVDNRRFVRKLGSLPQNVKTRLMENITIVLDL